MVKAIGPFNWRNSELMDKFQEKLNRKITEHFMFDSGTIIFNIIYTKVAKEMVLEAEKRYNDAGWETKFEETTYSGVKYYVLWLSNNNFEMPKITIQIW